MPLPFIDLTLDDDLCLPPISTGGKKPTRRHAYKPAVPESGNKHSHDEDEEKCKRVAVEDDHGEPCRTYARHAFEKAGCAVCGEDDMIINVPCEWYCKCDDLHLCGSCFAKMPYQPGSACSVCHEPLDKSHLLRDQQVMKAFMAQLCSGPPRHAHLDLICAFNEWLDAKGGERVLDECVSIRMSSTPAQMLKDLGSADDIRIWAVDGLTNDWFPLEPNRALVLQSIGPNTMVQISREKPVGGE